MIETLIVEQLYSNDEIFRSLGVSNAGGIRLFTEQGLVTRAAVMTSVPGLHVVGENPYHDRMEAGILTYTAAGKLGEQSLSGVNIRITDQNNTISLFTGSRSLRTDEISLLVRNDGNTWGS